MYMHICYEYLEKSHIITIEAAALVLGFMQLDVEYVACFQPCWVYIVFVHVTNHDNKMSALFCLMVFWNA